MSHDNKLRWDLESIFPGGSNSTEFAEFRKGIATDIEKAQKTLADMPRQLDEANLGKWVAFLLLTQHIMERIDHASGFTTCLTDQNVTDDKARMIQDEMDALSAGWEALTTGIEELAIKVDDKDWAKLVGHEKISPAAFYWNELRTLARLRMAPELEKLATELAVNGYHSWNRLYMKIAGDLQTEFVENGKTEVLSMGQLATRLNRRSRGWKKPGRQSSR